MPEFTVGLIYNADLTKVVLINKKRPAWQVDRLNGAGGRREADETQVQCVSREVFEETGLKTAISDWHQFCVMDMGGAKIEFFAHRHLGSPELVHTTTDEEVGWYSVSNLPEQALQNIHWLVPLGLEKLTDDTLEYAHVTYKT